MFEDVEADFWKERIVHLMHRNMVRIGATRLSLAQTQEAFDNFAKTHPELKPVSTVSPSYATWELNFTNNLKFRLFIQSQIKASIMQKNGNDYVKLADCRFPNNPFPEIEEFLNLKDQYLADLANQKTQTLQNQRQMKTAQEFIKAVLNKKFGGTKTIWTLEEQNQTFLLKIEGPQQEKQEITLELFDFYKKIQEL